MNELFDAMGLSGPASIGAMSLAGLAFLSTIIGLAAKSEEAKKSPKLTRFLDLVQMIGKVVGAFAALLAAAILFDAFWWAIAAIIATAVVGIIILLWAMHIAKNDPEQTS